jgi:hypothetical protein
MDEGSEWIAASRSENNRLGSCEAHDLGISPEKDRGGTAGKVGEGEEGGVASCGKTRNRDGWAVSDALS